MTVPHFSHLTPEGPGVNGILPIVPPQEARTRQSASMTHSAGMICFFMYLPPLDFVRSIITEKGGFVKKGDVEVMGRGENAAQGSGSSLAVICLPDFGVFETFKLGFVGGVEDFKFGFVGGFAYRERPSSSRLRRATSPGVRG